MSRRYDLKPAYSFEEAKLTAGQMVTEDDYDILINSDCDAYDELIIRCFSEKRNR